MSDGALVLFGAAALAALAYSASKRKERSPYVVPSGAEGGGGPGGEPEGEPGGPGGGPGGYGTSPTGPEPPGPDGGPGGYGVVPTPSVPEPEPPRGSMRGTPVTRKGRLEATPVTPTPPAGGPGGVAPGEVFDWLAYYNQRVVAAAEAGRADGEVRTAADLRLYVCEAIFPGESWPATKSSPPWKKTIWSGTPKVLRLIAEASAWPGSGNDEIADRAVTFWVSVQKNILQCPSFGETRAFDSPEQCVATKTFPDKLWPPKATGEPLWRYYAWDRIVSLMGR